MKRYSSCAKRLRGLAVMILPGASRSFNPALLLCNLGATMGVRRNFSRGSNVDRLLIIFKLLTMQCKWTFTKRFAISTPQKMTQVTVTITKERFVGSNSQDPGISR